MIWTVVKVYTKDILTFQGDDEFKNHIVEFHNEKGLSMFRYQRDYPTAEVGDRYLFIGWSSIMTRLLTKTLIEIEL